MFGLIDLFSLILSIFIIFPVVSIIRESGFFIACKLLGAKDVNITIGSGPHLFRFSIFEIRRYYFMYSWCSYDELKNDTRMAHILLYSSPLLANLIVSLTINFLLANGMMGMEEFWNRFIFYAFYFILLDAVPLYYPDGQPSVGRVLYDLIRYGKRSDFERSDPQMEVSTDEFEDEKKNNKE